MVAVNQFNADCLKITKYEPRPTGLQVSRSHAAPFVCKHLRIQKKRVISVTHSFLCKLFGRDLDAAINDEKCVQAYCAYLIRPTDDEMRVIRADLFQQTDQKVANSFWRSQVCTNVWYKNLYEVSDEK